MLTPDAFPLVRVLGPEVGAVFADLHTEHGVDLHVGTGVEQIVGTDRAQGVRTTDGETIAGDLIVLGVGAAPRDELARRAGLEVDNGILVDEFLTTSDPRILAAGDVANAWHPLLGARLRVEHWDNAIKQGLAAAATMLGTRTAFTQLPFFYSDQYDFGMEYRGHATTWDQVVFRGDPGSREFLAFWLHQGHRPRGDERQHLGPGRRPGRPPGIRCHTQPRAPGRPDRRSRRPRARQPHLTRRSGEPARLATGWQSTRPLPFGASACPGLEWRHPMRRRLTPYRMSRSEAEKLVSSATPDAAAAAARLAMLPQTAWKALPVVRRALDLTRLAEIAAAQRSWVRSHTDRGALGSSRRPRPVPQSRWEPSR